MNPISDFRLKKFKNKYSGERAFVVGNGPSLRSQDITKLENEYTFVTSWFGLHKDYPLLKKVHYCLGAAKIWERGSLYPLLYYTINSNPNVIVFAESSFLSLNSKYHYFPEDKIFYLTLISPPRKRDGANVSGDIINPIELGTNAVQDIMLPIVYYMGFKDIYLLGCDCTISTDWNNFHFYDFALMPREIREHMNTQCKGFNLEQLELSYTHYKNFFEAGNRTIKNCTKGGNLEIFERVDFESLF